MSGLRLEPELEQRLERGEETTITLKELDARLELTD